MLATVDTVIPRFPARTPFSSITRVGGAGGRHHAHLSRPTSINTPPLLVDSQDSNSDDCSPINCCGTLLLSPDKTHCLLVLQKETQKWSLPKGSINEGEEFSTCMQRELLEETGVDLSQCRYRFHAMYRYRRYVVQIIQLLQPMDTLPLKTNDSNEIDRVAWIALRNVQQPCCRVCKEAMHVPLDAEPPLWLNMVTRHFLCPNHCFLKELQKPSTFVPARPPKGRGKESTYP